MIDRLLMGLRARDDVSAEEEEALHGLFREVREHRADETIIRADVELSSSALLLDGFACRYRDLHGGNRQISAVHVPGDYVDLHGFTLKSLDHSVLTLTPCRVAYSPHFLLRNLTAKLPHLARLLWLLTNVDAAIHREWEVSLGRRSALGRMAHLFCELQERLRAVGLADDDGYDFPMTQEELAECVGLTPIHVNRMLRELRERDLVHFRKGRVTILTPDALVRVAEFDPGYLFLERKPR